MVGEYCIYGSLTGAYTGQIRGVRRWSLGVHHRWWEQRRRTGFQFWRRKIYLPKGEFSNFWPGPQFSLFFDPSDSWEQQFFDICPVLREHAAAVRCETGCSVMMRSVCALSFYINEQAQIVIMSVWHHYKKDPTVKWNDFRVLSLVWLKKSHSEISQEMTG